MNEQSTLKCVFEPLAVLKDRGTHYCPGCQHGVGHRLMAECLSEMGLVEKTILASSVGCSVLIYNFFNLDTIESPHGRAPAVATGVKRAKPDCFVLTYQGDGDLASIGIGEIMHCANRGENISVIFINNTVFGMTGGQMAPTTLQGQVTTTSPVGRSYSTHGYPFNMAEIIASLGGVAFSARGALNNVRNITQAKKFMKKAFACQVEEKGFGFVELLATCPTNWKMSPTAANERLEKEMIPAFPLGVYKDNITSGEQR